MKLRLAAAILAFHAAFAFAAPPERAEDVRPVLVGTRAPDVPLRTLDGAATTLHAQLAGKPTVLAFYRGGWCPYCNLQLSELRHLRDEFEADGFQLLALSADGPEALRATLDQTPLEYTLLSDGGAAAMQAFGIAFRVDAATIEKYRGYGIDLEQASGHTHHLLPVPAVFVLDAKGTIAFHYVNPDYRTRVPARLVRAAIETVEAGEAGRLLR